MAGIYVHVPFCHSKCFYCDFFSIANISRCEEYVKAVEREYTSRRNEINDKVETIYFGGGTPSLLSPALFRRLAQIFGEHTPSEFTIEANPEDIDSEHIEAWLNCGVNRVSIGIQSLNDDELKAVNRRHDAKGAVRAIQLLQESGIENISADLIYGLPGQTENSWHDSLNALIETGVQHISAYCLGFEEGTVLWQRRERGIVAEASEETLVNMYQTLCRSTAAAGYSHYEISNIALPGYRSKHNSAYWNGTPYLGLGPGAHSLGDDGKRRYVPGNIKAYITDPENAAVIDEETETDKINDFIMVSLRTAAGLSLEQLPPDAGAILLSNARTWLRTGSLRNDNSRIYIPEEHWLMSDAIIRDLLLP